MGLKALNAAQESAIARLVRTGQLESVVADAVRAQTFLRRVDEALADVSKVGHAHTAFNLAYDACHDIGEAVLAAYGYRTRSGPGQHAVLGRFLAVVFDAPPGQAAAERFDRLRRARNGNRYEAKPVGRAQADDAARAARELCEAARERGIGR